VRHLILIRHPRNGTEAPVIASSLPVWEKHGWRTVKSVDNTPDQYTVKQILSGVGNDPAKAASALEAELARPEPRKSLTTKLSRIANAEEA
jgi:hypothetical protein